mmetsp:Transcript_24054/g.67388  ORF Transcript_24054/g.67388 Transcript_24054/m.67388 type:complete len:218 (-) Transcript_24054:493-1146(-)
MDLVLAQLGVVQRLLHGLHGLLEQPHVELLELGPGEGLGKVLAVAETLNLHAGLVLLAELALGLLGLATQLLQGFLILAAIITRLLLVQLQEVLHHVLVKVLPAQVRVTRRGEHLEDPVVDGEDGHIERAASQIVHHDVLLPVLLVEAVGDRRGRGLVEDAQDVQPRDRTGILGSLPLGVVEVRRHGNHRVRHLLAQIRLGRLLHLLQDHGRHLLRR